MSKAKTDGIKLIANNKKARHDYFVEDSFEAGIVLHGTEVKSLRQGHCSIKESFVDIDNGEVFIHHQSNFQNHSVKMCLLEDAQNRDSSSFRPDLPEEVRKFFLRLSFHALP